MSSRLPVLVAVAHGSRDPRAAAATGELLDVVRGQAASHGLAGLDVRAAFLGHCAPSLPQALSAVAAGGAAHGGTRAVVVPLLLTSAYHAVKDIPAQLAAASAAARPGIAVAETLGHGPFLIGAMERRLAETGAVPAGERARTGVVLAAAGSSDATANAGVAALAARWQRDGGWRRVTPAFASAAAPPAGGTGGRSTGWQPPAEAVRALRAEAGIARVVVATYLLAPGYFAEKIRAAAAQAGAAAVCGVLGAAPEVARVILARYAAAASFPPIVARAQLPGTDHGYCLVSKLIQGGTGHPGARDATRITLRG